MKETGIIMSGDHPRKVLDGLKIMTRRTWGLERFNESPNDWVVHHVAGSEWEFKNIKTLADYHIFCPYGQVGDRLVIKEAWATEYQFDNLKPSEIPRTARIYYLCDDLRGIAFIGRKRSARFMCNWMSRVRSEITEVRAERLQDISEEDCYKEGLNIPIGMMLGHPHWLTGDILQRKFKELWDSLNAKRGHGWDKNDWVWPIGYKLLPNV